MNVLKKVIGWVGAWSFFGVAHVLSKVMNLNWWTDGVIYTIYNNFMLASVTIQDWAGLKSPWIDPAPLTEEDLKHFDV